MSKSNYRAKPSEENDSSEAQNPNNCAVSMETKNRNNNG